MSTKQRSAGASTGEEAPIVITTPARRTAPVEVTAKDLQGHGVIHCPNAHMPQWSSHPRVYIDLTSGEGQCPYCGTAYRLNGGLPHGH
jgi:uncharacterized Zn-finger protein